MMFYNPALPTMRRLWKLVTLLLCLSHLVGASLMGEEPYSKSHNMTSSSPDESYTPECTSHDCSILVPGRTRITMAPSTMMDMDDDYDDGYDSFVVTGEEDYQWGGLDILVTSFFLIAACWLLMAIVYSILILILLRMQARGDLDFYDEDFGLWVCCNGRFRLHFGCILRRYAIQLATEQQQQTR
jgi:hypothetical protein